MKRRWKWTLVILGVFLAVALSAGVLVIRWLFTPAEAGWRRDRTAHRSVPLPDGRGWRGDGSGVYPDAHPPLHWSSTANVVWRTPMPSRSNATPVPFGDRVFVTAEPDLVMAVRAADGAILWQHHVPALSGLPPEEMAAAEKALKEAEGVDQALPGLMAELAKLKRDARMENPPAELPARIAEVQQSIASMQARQAAAALYVSRTDDSYIGDAAQTPVTDGKSVFVAFGSFVVAAFDLEGNRRWLVRLPHSLPDHQNGERVGVGASLLLAADRLIVPMGQLFGLDPETGHIEWTRNYYRSWGTPARATLGSTEVIGSPSGDVIRAEDGALLARFVAPSQFTGPVASGNVLMFVGENKSVGALGALLPDSSRLPPPTGAGPADEDTGGLQVSVLNLPHAVAAYELPVDDTKAFNPRLIWHSEQLRENRSTPLVLDGRLIAIEADARLRVFDAHTGQLLHSKRLDTDASVVSSPAVAGDNLYVITEAAKTYVLSPAEPYGVLAENKLEDDSMRASPVFDGNHLYLRTWKYLYCIGNAAIP
jgi:outer membrane protein assembly factor BamB